MRVKSEAYAIALAASRCVCVREREREPCFSYRDVSEGLARAAEFEAQGALMTVMRDPHMDTPLSQQQLEEMQPHQMAASMIGRLKQITQWVSTAESKHRRQLQRLKSPGSWTYDMGFRDGMAKAERRESEPAKNTRSHGQTGKRKEEETQHTKTKKRRKNDTESEPRIDPMPTPPDDPPTLFLSDSPEY